MLAIIYYLAFAGLLLSVSLSAPILIAVIDGDRETVLRLLIYLAMGGFLSGAVMMALTGRLRRIPAMGNLLLLSLVWIALPLLIAIPVSDLAGLGYTDALFEAASGLTTNGATVIANVESLPRAVIFFRSLLHFMGGYFVILTILLILSPMGVGGLPAQRLALSGGVDSSSGQDRLWRLGTGIGTFYSVLALLCFLGLVLAGARPFDALNIALVTVSSGGFLPFDDVLQDRVGNGGLLVMTVFLIISATSVFWHRMVMRFDRRRLSLHRESYFVFGAVIVIAGFVLSTLLDASAATGFPILIESVFNAASIVSTSGVESRPGLMSLLPINLILFAILVGGSAYSTSGGLKLYRIGGMLAQSTRELDKLIYPHAVRPARFGSQIYDMTMMKAVWSFFVVSILIIAIGTVLVSLSSSGFDAALMAVVCAFSGAGPVYDSGWAAPGTQPWPEWAALSDTAKLTLVAIMILGRVEVLAVFAIFSLKYFTNR